MAVLTVWTVAFIVNVSLYNVLGLHVQPQHLMQHPRHKRVDVGAILPTTPTVKNVVFALVRGPSPDSPNVLNVVNAWNVLQSKMPPDELYDSVVFHEGDISSELQQSALKDVPRLRFIDVHTVGGFDDNMTAIKAEFGLEYPIGYKHMCRFNSMQWFPVLQNYEYALRVDDDITIKNMNSSPFRILKEKNAVYGAGVRLPELHFATQQTMGPWVMDYLVRNNITPKGSPDIRYMFFTNVFVARVSWWLRHDVGLFLAAIDNSSNIYRYRWGDAPIQTAALDIFAKPGKVLILDDLSYYHGSTGESVFGGRFYKSDGNNDLEAASNELAGATLTASMQKSGFLS